MNIFISLKQEIYSSSQILTINEIEMDFILR